MALGIDSLFSLVENAFSAFEDVEQQVTNVVMDYIYSSSTIRTAWKAAMITGSLRIPVQTSSMWGDRALMTVSGLSLFSNATSLSDALVLAGGSSAASAIINTLSDQAGSSNGQYYTTMLNYSFQVPNVGGVPIGAASVTMSQDVDVGEHLLISQSTSSKKYWIDNAVPHLKEWTIDGYISTSLEIDHYYIVRPSLWMQVNSLDQYIKSRRPILFKDNRNQFQFVLITHLEISQDATYNNALKVNMILREFVPFEVESTISTVSAELLGDALS